MRTITGLSLSAAACLTAGCVNLQLPMSTVQDVAIEQNFAAQVVDPTPAEGAPTQEAYMTDAAIERYQNDEVKQAGAESEEQTVNLNFSPEGGGGGQ